VAAFVAAVLTEIDLCNGLFWSGEMLRRRGRGQCLNVSWPTACYGDRFGDDDGGGGGGGGGGGEIFMSL
jgi:hypothetical protein